MDVIQSEIERNNRLLAQHPFFGTLRETDDLEDFRTLLEGVAWFTFSFQDLLRINEARIQDPTLAALAKQHRREDAGHEVWFLEDAKEFGVDLSLGNIASGDHQGVRDVAWEIVSEVYRASNDEVRIAVPLALEASGYLFLSSVAQFVERCGFSTRYFGAGHVEEEGGHEIFEAEQAEVLSRYPCDGAVGEEAKEAVRRMFAAKGRMLDALQDLLTRRRRARAPASVGQA